ncbi:MAG: amidohydrolase [Planctomycetota bacterium]|nr:MAG: amidohydrolase [Planctomycetota bacterium]
MKKYDSHVHFWDTTKLDYPWLTDIPELNRSFLPESYLNEIGDDDIAGCIFVQCDAISSQNLVEVEWVEDYANKFSFIKGIVAAAPIEIGEKVRPIIEELNEKKLVKGVRRLLQGEDADFALNHNFLKGIKVLQEFDIPFDICIKGDKQMATVEKLINKFENQVFILDHCGKPNLAKNEIKNWEKQLKLIGQNENVYCKLSGLLTEMNSAENTSTLLSVFDIIFESFGIDRILFGSDWPVCQLGGGYQKWLGVVDEYLNTFSIEEQSKVYATNTMKAYQLI